MKLLKKPAMKTSWSSCLWATRRVIGATLWSANRLKMKTSVVFSTRTMSASKSTVKNDQMLTECTWTLFRQGFSLCESKKVQLAQFYTYRNKNKREDYCNSQYHHVKGNSWWRWVAYERLANTWFETYCWRDVFSTRGSPLWAARIFNHPSTRPN